MARKGSHKVRTGCITCKIRKVKCDETKPSCDRCTNTGRRCDGYAAPLPTVRPWDASRGPVRFPKAEVTLEESRALDFFHRRVTSTISGHHHTDFWTHVVVQVCQQEPAVRHAAVAISTLYEHLGEDTKPEGDAFAIKQYNESIKALIKTNDQSVALFSCVLLMCAEFIQGNVQTAIRHCRHGVILLNSGCIPQWTHERLLPMFCRLSIFPYFFGCRPSEGPNDREGFPLLLGLDEMSRLDGITSLQQAQDSLGALVSLSICFGRSGDKYKDVIRVEPHPSVFAEQAMLLERLDRWDIYFQAFRKAKVLSAAEITASLFLEMKHTVGTIWVKMALEPSEEAFSEHVAAFKKMVNAATLCLAVSLSQPRPKFLFEMCFLPLLYFVVTKCRDLSTRTAALRLMKVLAGAQEILWNASVMSEVGRQVIEMEHGIELDRNGYEKGSEGAKLSLDDGGPPIDDMVAINQPDDQGHLQSPADMEARRFSFLRTESNNSFIPRERVIPLRSNAQPPTMDEITVRTEKVSGQPCRELGEMDRAHTRQMTANKLDC